MSIVSYKGYVLQPAPYRLAESGRWVVKVYIEIHDIGRITVKNFTAHESTFATEEEAIPHCLEFGRRIIDGKQPGLSLASPGPKPPPEPSA